ncbi:MAG TPA: SAM-dependent methyltransferase [Acidimicrobiales bacterium]
MTDRVDGGLGPMPVEIDPNVPHSSRVYDYLLGGTDNFPADREVAHQMSAALPGGIDASRANARTNRVFLGQAVRYLAGQQGIRQFLDIGPGIPVVNQTHEVAQQIAPDSRIVYADNDPIVLAHAHTLLKSTAEGHTDFIEGDLRDPGPILERAAESLDFDQPVALMLVAIFHMIPDEDRPYDIVRQLTEALAPGSYIVLSHLTADIHGQVMADAIEHLGNETREPFVPRTREEFTRLLDGWELVPPGVAQIDEWLRTGPLPPPPDAEPRRPEGLPDDWRNPLWAAMGRKP